MAEVDTPQQPAENGSGSSKLPSSVTRVYNVPLVKDSVNYADSVLRSYPLSAALYQKTEAVATALYKRAGEPIQDKLQPQINQLDGLANKTLDYVQGRAPYIFDAKTDELVATARKPADQAYASAKGYQDAVSARLHDTLVASQQSIGGLQERLGLAAAKVPKSTAEAQQVAQHLLEHLESLKNALLKQSQDLPAHVSKAVEPYIAKLQKGASEVKVELAKKDVPVHLRAQHIIAITRDITADTLHEALESVRYFSQQITHKAESEANKPNGISENGHHAVESTEQFVAEHTPGDHSYAEAVKEN
ncbi:hypothetical protein EMMF5_002364 [Cystobasidiomycetes sp. EMM_F5]